MSTDTLLVLGFMFYAIKLALGISLTAVAATLLVHRLIGD